MVVDFATPFRERTLALLDDPAELDRSSPTAPSGPVTWPAPTLARVYDRVGFLAGAGAGAGSPTMPHDRRRDRHPRAATAPSCSAPGRRSVTRWPTRSRRTSRCCRRPRCRDDDLDQVERAPGAVGGRARRRSTCTCAAPARSARSRRWSSSRSPTGIGDCEQLERDVRGGPLAATLDFPYHPHVTVAHHVDDSAMDRAFEDLASYHCTFEVQEFHLYARLRPGMARRGRLLLRRRANRGRGRTPIPSSTTASGCSPDCRPGGLQSGEQPLAVVEDAHRRTPAPSVGPASKEKASTARHTWSAPCS